MIPFLMACLAFALPLALYLRFPSSMWNFDGVACAMALEIGDSLHFFHSNHLLYAFLGYGFWKFLLFPLGIARALPALQLLTSLLSAIGLLGLYHLLEEQFEDPISSALLTVCLSVTAVFWVWSLEAQVYTLGFAALSWATYLLLRPAAQWKWQKVGFLHGLAVLGHVLNALWLVPAVYWLSQTEAAGRPRKQSLRTYLKWLALVVLIPYLLVLAFVILPAHPEKQGVLTWLWGSAALTPNRHFAWHSVGWSGPFQWLYTTLRFFWGSFWPYNHASVGFFLWLLTALSAGILAMIGIGILRQGKKPLVIFSLLWLGVYGIFLWTWEPGMECYRLTDAVPIAILLALGMKNIRERTKIRALAILLMSLFAINLSTLTLPMSRPSQNALYMEVIRLSQMTPANSLYLTLGGKQWIYILYFSGRQALNIELINPIEPLQAEMKKYRHVHLTFVRLSDLKNDRFKKLLAPFRFRPVNSLAWVQVL